jgi:hypothetical protein
MKVVMRFDFDAENFDKVHFKDALNGQKWRLTIWEFDQWLRSNTKHAPDSMSKEQHNAYQKTREELHRFLNEANLMLDEDVF